jgi:hypothetical protein
MHRKALAFAITTLFALAPGVLSLATGGHGDKQNDKLMAAMQGFHHHFCGIHVVRDDQKKQFITQHYCGPRSEDMFQCLLFDSTEKNAKLIGVEYIISDKKYRELPEKERKYWHPHTYEVLEGGLIAPGMPQGDEDKFMKAILTTWGKTIHTWPDPSTEIPMGEPLLMWSLSGDGQDDPKVIAERDRQFKVSVKEIRERRTKLFGLEVPQVEYGTPGRQWTTTGPDTPTERKK